MRAMFDSLCITITRVTFLLINTNDIKHSIMFKIKHTNNPEN